MFVFLIQRDKTVKYKVYLQTKINVLKLNNVTITEGNSITRYITLYEFQVKRDLKKNIFLLYVYDIL